MRAVGREDQSVTPEMAQPGDVIIDTKGSGSETVGIFASLFPETIRRNPGDGILECGQSLLYKMSTVEDALTEASVGLWQAGVTTFHDATQCGVISTLAEIAQASQVGMYVRKADIPVQPGVPEICEYFEMDPYISISEGTLLMTVKPEKADVILCALRERRITAATVGGMLSEERGVTREDGGVRKSLRHPRVDFFWTAIQNAFERGLP
ncbi:MAG: AIR synthase-related protein [bacterium JZ-2024 1]